MFITYIVNKNETLDSISRKFNVTSEDIFKVNNLNNNNIAEGTRLKIPVSNRNFNYYQTKEGDNLYDIARRNSVDLELLALVNGLMTYDYLHPNQIIIIPKKEVKYYLTKENDTLQSVSRTINSNIQSIVANNPNIYLLDGQLIAYK